MFFSLVLATAFAQEIPALTQEPSGHTYWLVVGTSEYDEAPDLPGVDGATEDCERVSQHLLDFGYMESEVIPLCGRLFSKNAFVARLQETVTKMTPGDTLNVVVIGHGGADPKRPEVKFWQAADGDFSSLDGYIDTAIDPMMVVGLLRSRLPAGASYAIFSDTARGGEYHGISLIGPSGSDFADDVLAITTDPGNNEPNVFGSALVACVTNDGYDYGPGIKPFDFYSCLNNTLEGGVAENGNWYEDKYLTWFPPGKVTMAPTPVALPLPPEPVEPHRVSTRSIARWGSVSVTAAGLAVGVYGFATASGIKADIADENGHVDPKNEGELERYNNLKVLTYGSWGVAALGATGATLTFVF